MSIRFTARLQKFEPFSNNGRVYSEDTIGHMVDLMRKSNNLGGFGDFVRAKMEANGGLFDLSDATHVVENYRVVYKKDVKRFPRKKKKEIKKMFGEHGFKKILIKTRQKEALGIDIDFNFFAEGFPEEMVKSMVPSIFRGYVNLDLPKDPASVLNRFMK